MLKNVKKQRNMINIIFPSKWVFYFCKVIFTKIKSIITLLKHSKSMKNRSFLSYGFVASMLLLLQSCVSNYAISVPQMYAPKMEKNEEASSYAEKVETIKKEELKNVAIVKGKEAESLAVEHAKNKKSQTIDDILNEASTYIGTPYRMGGMTRNGIDCSAFVLSVYGSAAGIELPRVSSAQAQKGERVEKSELEKGDLLFFQTRGKRISHVGIVQDITPDGEIKFIHASSSKGVIISSLNEKYWGARYRFAKRVLIDGASKEAL